MRKLLPILVIILITFSLLFQACESTPETKPTTSPEATETSTPSPESSEQPETTPTQEPKPDTIEVSAGDLYSEYQSNQVAADAKYEDEILTITGIVDSVGKDVLDTPYIVLTDGDKFALFGVQCMFKEKDDALMCMPLMTRDKKIKYEAQAVIFSDLKEQAAESGFVLYLLDNEGRVLEKL